MPEKQLELSKRSAFFKDPFFQDLRSGLDDGLEKRLAEFSARSLGVSGAGLGEAAHNIQVSASNDKFMIQLELPGFSPEDFSLKTKEVKVKVENLTEDEKYRRMRVQNNDASKRCREKRKRKHQQMEEELEFLQDKNQNLKEKVELMEREVRAMKRRLLDDISSK